MSFFSRRYVRRMSCFFSRKAAQMTHAFLDGDLSNPRTQFKPRTKSDTFQPMPVAGLTVGSVLSVSSFSQILKTVVRFIAIFVVNLFFRPAFPHIEPRQAVLGVAASVDLKMSISSVMQTSSALPDADLRTRGAPRKNTRIRVVSQYLSQIAVLEHARHLAGHSQRLQGACT